MKHKNNTIREITKIKNYLNNGGIFFFDIIGFSRKNLSLKKIVGLANKNNIKLIEIAFEKSNLTDEQYQSDAIIHGLNNGTIEVIKKIIDSLK